jgi:hypothetical protein
VKTDSTKTGRDYLDELDFWADKELNARLALQKAEAEMNACAARRSKAFAELADYVRALEAKPKDVQP